MPTQTRRVLAHSGAVVGTLLGVIGFVVGLPLAAQPYKDVHPNEKNLRARIASSRVSIASEASGVKNLDELARRLRGALRIDSIGEVDGEESKVLGTIMDVAADPAGRLFVLDMAFQQVRVFDARGLPQFAFGQRGSGPLDFRFAVAMWVPKPGELVVVDPILGAKHIAAVDKKSLRLLKTTRIAGNATGGCGIANMVTAYSPVHDSATTTIVHRYDTGGRKTLAIGSGYVADSRLVREIMSEGVVACAPNGWLIAALSKLPFVQGFDASGQLRWTARLSDFKIGRELEELDSKGGHSIGLDPNAPDHSYIRRLSMIGDGLVVVQVTVNTARSLRAQASWARVETYIFDLESGRGVFVSTKLPIIATTRGDNLIGFENDPFPRVVVLKLPN